MPFPDGYRLRPPTTADGPIVVAMLNEETMALADVAFTSLDWVAGPWTAPGVDLERNYAVVQR